MDSIEGDKEIIRYPYLASVRQLIDCFLIVGYPLATFENAKLENKNSEIKNKLELYTISGERATILNCVYSDFCKQKIEEDLIPKLIFPNGIKIYELAGHPVQMPTFLHPYSVIFSFNNDSLIGSSKSTMNYFAYVFYEMVNIKNKYYAIEKAFCIISQLPFFNLYFNISKKILELFKKEIDMPLEIIITNLVNFLPSPITKPLSINLKNLFTFTQNAITNIKSHKLSQTLNYDYNNQGNANNNSFEKPAPSIQEPKKSKYQYMGEVYEFKEPLNHNQILENKELFELKILNGFQLCDFKANAIFHILPIDIVAEILVFNFLEIDMLFFSKSIEILNILMYTIASTSYPCTDTQYLWNIVSISLDDLINNSNNPFVGKPFSSILGVNCTYESDIDTSAFSSCHFIVDIDNKCILLKSYDDNEQSTNIQQLYLFVHSCLENNNSKNSKFLSQSLKKLTTGFSDICKKLYNKTFRPINPKGKKAQDSDVVRIDFFNVDYEISRLDNSLMDYSFDFVIDELKAFYTFYKPQREDNSYSIKIKYTENFEEFCNEEKILFDIMKNTFKNSVFYEKFVAVRECINVYKIPFLFTEEFIILQNSIPNSNIGQIAYNIIENFYKPIKENNINNSNNDLDDDQISYSFKVGFNEINNYLKEPKRDLQNIDKNESAYFNLFIDEVKNSPLIYMQKKLGKNIPFYRTSELDSDLLLKYKYFITNIEQEKLSEIFPSLNLMTSEEYKIPSIKSIDLLEHIEKELILNKLVVLEDLILFTLLILSGILSEEYGFDVKLIITAFEKLKICKRKYLKYYLKILTHMFLKKLENKNDQNYNEEMKFLDLLLNHVIKNQILPDKEILDSFSYFDDLIKKSNIIYDKSKDNSESQNNNYVYNEMKFTLIKKKDDKKKNDKKKRDEDKKIDDNDSLTKDMMELAKNIIFNGDLNLNDPDGGVGSFIPTELRITINGKSMNVKVFSPNKMLIESEKISKIFLKYYSLKPEDKMLFTQLLINLSFYINNNDKFIFYQKKINIINQYLTEYIENNPPNASE